MAYYLPALQKPYMTIIRKLEAGNVPLPKAYSNWNELNWLDPRNPKFSYNHVLQSAGHVQLSDYSGNSEAMYRNAASNVTLVADSGGYQIGKNVDAWRGNWSDPNDSMAAAKRKQVYEWSQLFDYAMTLDIPTWCQQPALNTPRKALDATCINNDWYIRQPNRKCKFLNTVQGKRQDRSAEYWLKEVSKYQIQRTQDGFEGWAFADEHVRNPLLLIEQLLRLLKDNMLDNSWIHVLGIGRMSFAVLFYEIENALRNIGINVTISFDSSSASAPMQYREIVLHSNSNGSLVSGRMLEARTGDTRTVKQAYTAQYGQFVDSPFTANVTMDELTNDEAYVTIAVAHYNWHQIKMVKSFYQQYDDTGLVHNLGESFEMRHELRAIFKNGYISDRAMELFKALQPNKLPQGIFVDDYAKQLMDVPRAAKQSDPVKLSPIYLQFR